MSVGSPYYVSVNATIGAYCQSSHIVGLLQMYCDACGTLIQMGEEIDEELTVSWLGHSVSFSYSGVRLAAGYSPYYLWSIPLMGLSLSIVMSSCEN